MSPVSMIIGGERREGSATFPVIDPATGQAHAEAPDCSPQLLDQAMDAAAGAFESWRKNDDARRTALREAASLLKLSAEYVGPLLTGEHGKPLTSARSEVEGASSWFEY